PARRGHAWQGTSVEGARRQAAQLHLRHVGVARGTARQCQNEPSRAPFATGCHATPAFSRVRSRADAPRRAVSGHAISRFSVASSTRISLSIHAVAPAAQPGDAIILQAGATYSGNFTLPTKSGSGWIYVQSSALSSLPAAGTRVGPAQANLMPKIVSPNTMPAISTAAAAHHFRFVGVE